MAIVSPDGRRGRRRVWTLLSVLAAASCGPGGPPAPTGPTLDGGTTVRDNASLFRLVTETDPFTGYARFPNADEFTDGRLNGSEAHRPTVRVSLNARALGALQNGRLPTGGAFPDGSIIFKEVKPRADAATTLYAVMYKDAGSALAGNGWVWAEFSPTGSVAFSVSSRGSACTSCHLREQGPVNDLVRTFERQR